jgi:transmembrane sensor
MHQVDLNKLLSRYRNGESTPEEIAEVESYYNYIAAKTDFASADIDFGAIGEEIWNNIHSAGLSRSEKTFSISSVSKVAAAVLLVAFTTGIYFLTKTKNKEKTEITQNEDFPPGGYNATLTLANGKDIDLGTAKIGPLAMQNGMRISKQDSDLIIYQAVNPDDVELSTVINTITTPNGGEYRVMLPDGSMVFLNAASSLKYPANFTSATREVYLTGEGYFEVIKNPRQPFIVMSSKQNVKVLGTHFNIRSYPDGPVVTTLTEGSVSVSTLDTSSPQQQHQLKPGQQAMFKSGWLSIKDVDTTHAIAWKNGLFFFSQTPIRDALREISRWYNVNVDYNSIPEGQKVGATCHKSDSLSTLLKSIGKMTNLRLVVKRRIITID